PPLHTLSLHDALPICTIDLSLLHPTLSDNELRAGCERARRLGVASVCIKPYAVPLAVELLAGSGVAVGTVIGFPHGGQATEIKADRKSTRLNSSHSQI